MDVAFLSLLFIIKPKWLNEQIKTLYMSKSFTLWKWHSMYEIRLYHNADIYFFLVRSSLECLVTLYLITLINKSLFHIAKITVNPSILYLKVSLRCWKPARFSPHGFSRAGKHRPFHSTGDTLSDAIIDCQFYKLALVVFIC